ncbi:Ankyrin [Reticulomyxa filosa]|uniref:Ankyrin n=1 Tax=Reticulomyxa filosa TaxID=46433 RepID=X6N1A6_RETFI|nr:Ankyrin [Reticulomyxa filosa]|eukprot:ETO19499.1 Ankyrin [Reticulomyxa filosa]
MIACGCKRDKQKKLVIEEFNENEIDEKMAGETLEMINMLLDNDCDVNLQNREGMTALMFACIAGDVSWVKLLAEFPRCDLEISSSLFHSKTALLFAAQSGRQDVIQSLLSSGADINAVTDSEDNALILAAIQGSPLAVQCLIENEIDINSQNKVLV